MSSARIGLFGGSFNPIHWGHIHLAEKALARYQLDEIVFIPAHVSPFKTEGCKIPYPLALPDALREKMVQGVCAQNPRFSCWTIELERGCVSYAIDTVRAARVRFPDAELFFLIGEDSVAGLPRWKEWSLLKTLCRFVIFPRTVESSTEVRRRLLNHESISSLVPPCVEEILLERGV